MVDMVSMSRAFIADPKWAAKARIGQDEDIAPCLRCKMCFSDSNRGCTVNPRYNWSSVNAPDSYPVYDAEIKENPAGFKKVVVVGAGPAGITASIHARTLGHNVILIDSNNFTGGAIEYIAMSDYKYEASVYLKYLRRQLDKSGTELMLGTVATPQLVHSLAPDVIVLAMGAKPIKPPIKGIDLPFVMDCYEASTRKEKWGKRLAIIGGGANGVEFALEQSLIKGSHSVIIETTDTLAAKAQKDFRIYAKQLFDKTDLIETLTETRCTGITQDGVNIESADGSKRFIPCDGVIYCVGLGAPSSDELWAYFGYTPQTYIIGDCRAPRVIKDAVTEGYNIARNI